MANKKSAKKMIVKIAKRTLRNKSLKTKSRTYIRNVKDAIKSGNKALALEKFQETSRILHKISSKGILHINTVSRKISRLSAKIKSMEGEFMLPVKLNNKKS